jgi:effector-binding domain-containing protein
MDDIELNHTIPRTTAVVRARVPMRDLPGFLSHAFAAVAEALARQGVHVTGPPLALYRSVPAGAVDVEAGFPVAAEVAPEGDVQPSSLPGGDAAETVHIGPYETLGDTYRDMCEWMERHGRRPSELSWESYLTGPDDPAGPETLVVWPFAQDAGRSAPALEPDLPAAAWVDPHRAALDPQRQSRGRGRLTADDEMIMTDRQVHAVAVPVAQAEAELGELIG